MKKFMFLLCMELFLKINYVFSQTDSSSFHLRHNIQPPPLYVLEGLVMDSSTFMGLSFEKKQIRKIVLLKDTDALKEYGDRVKNGVIEVYTKAIVVLNGIQLLSREEKVKQLSGININQKSILKLIKDKEAVKMYGKQAKYGAIQIVTSQ